VDGVAHAPGGAHPTSCGPERPRDLAFLKAYVASAAEDGGWDRFRGTWVDGVSEADYQRRVAEEQR
jgi:glutaconate CoA-transferase subunit A